MEGAVSCDFENHLRIENILYDTLHECTDKILDHVYIA